MTTTSHPTPVPLTRPAPRAGSRRTTVRQLLPVLAIAALAPIMLLPADVLVALAGVGLLVALLVATADWAARDSFTAPPATGGHAARGDHASYDAREGARADALARLARSRR